MKTKIYMLPGLMTDERLWSRLTPLFDENYELIHVELPLMSKFDDIVDYLYKEIKDEKINLLGFSLGGYTASYFALKYPNRVNKLFILAATASTMPEDELERRRSSLNLMKNLAFNGLTKDKVISLLEVVNQKDEELIVLIQNMYKDLGKDVLTSQLGTSLYRKNLTEGLCSLKIETTFLYSTNDRLLNYDWLDEFKKRDKIAQLNEIESISHMLPLERPSTVAKYMKDFF